MRAFSSRPEEGLVCLKADLWIFSIPTPVGYPLVWQLRAEEDPHVSHSKACAGWQGSWAKDEGAALALN